jgi:hypothetical protein
MVRNRSLENLPEPRYRPFSASRREGRIAASTYGYHNTFHTHAQSSIIESDPPSYENAVCPSRLPTSSDSLAFAESSDVLPDYSCTIEREGIADVRCELSSPFLECCDNRWHSNYIILHGTQLSLHKVKTSGFASKNKRVGIGRHIRTYSLQHAEVGVAVDWRKGELIPKSPLAKLVPAAARQKLWETDPDLFEPIREWVLRLRLEGEQLLICAQSQDAMLTWVEKLCAAIDIAPPLEDRCEPRYRSLPRRNRRQREIEGIIDHLENLQDDDAGRRFLEQQERLIRRLYPHLAREGSSTDADLGSRYPASSNEPDHRQGASQDDPDTEDLDPADVAEGSNSADSRPATSLPSSDTLVPRSAESEDIDVGPALRESFNPKTAPSRFPSTEAAQLRYRKRCAPILLSGSPRASEIIFYNNRRMRVDFSRNRLIPFEMSPPRYEVGSYTQTTPPLASVLEESSLSPPAVRPALGTRESSYRSTDTSFSFGEELSQSNASGDSSTLYTNPSSTELDQNSLRLDGNEDLRIERCDSTQNTADTDPPSPVRSDFAQKTKQKGTAILFVRRFKDRSSTNVDSEHTVEAAQLPFVV